MDYPSPCSLRRIPMVMIAQKQAGEMERVARLVQSSYVIAELT